MDPIKKIDLSEILKEKSPFFYRIIPKFFVAKLKQIVREKDINIILKKLNGKEKLKFISGSLKELGVTSQNSGFKDLPLSERVIIVANHPLGGLDGLAMIHELGKYRKDIKFLVNDILTSLTPFKEYFIPINKHGLNSRENILRLEKLFESNNCIVIFPAGLVSRKQKNKIKDLEWRKTFISKAKKYKTTIYPVFIDGENSSRFYRVANWRKFWKINLNLEMFLLPGEMFLQKGNSINFIMGKPISSKELNNSKSDLEWAQLVKEYVYKIKNNSNFKFKDFIKK